MTTKGEVTSLISTAASGPKMRIVADKREIHGAVLTEIKGQAAAAPGKQEQHQKDARIAEVPGAGQDQQEAVGAEYARTEPEDADKSHIALGSRTHLTFPP